MKLQNLSAQTPPLNFKRKSLVSLKLFPINKLHITLNSCLSLCSPRARSAPQPVALKTQDSLNSSVRILLNLSLNFLFIKIIRIISLIKFYPMPEKLKNIVADRIQKITVMSNHQDRPVRIAKIILQPGNSLYIKMVSRLIQKQKFSVLH